MNFVKSNLAKKLIIILIALMLLNFAIPNEVKAVDLGGILRKPVYMLWLDWLVNIDISVSSFLCGAGMEFGLITLVIDAIFSNDGYIYGVPRSEFVNKLFIGPDTIFSGRVTILDANIFDTDDSASDEDDKPWFENMKEEIKDTFTGNQGTKIVNKVKEAIAGIYVILRNICAIIMLGGLIYTGIKILLTSNSPTKKSQYTMLLYDWGIGLALLLFSHVIMVGIFYISDTITNALLNVFSENGCGINATLILECVKSFEKNEQIMLLIMLAYTIWLTVVFAIAYFKRFFMIAIMIVFAPVVSILYAFGQQTKQIYSKWLREYILAVFVQPFHMLVYFVLVMIPLGITSSDQSFNLTGGSFEMFYALVAMSFIRPAEKFMRGLFGMNQGIANMASYDSGKQVIDGAVKTAVAVGAAAVGLGTAVGAVGGASGLISGISDKKPTDLLEEEKANNKTNPAEAMLDAYDEGFGSSDYDPEYREQLAREAGGDMGSFVDTWQDQAGYLEWMARNEGFDTVEQLRDAYGTDGINQMLEMAKYKPEDVDDFSEGDIRELTDGLNHANEGGNNLNASNITITAGQVNMQGELNNSGSDTIRTIESVEETQENNTTDSTVEIGETDELDVSAPESLADTFGRYRDAGVFSALGKLGSALYTGAHTMADTLYVDSAPQDWKNTAGLMDGFIKNSDEKRKRNVELQKANWANNRENISIMTDIYMPDFMEKMQKKYKGKDQGYIESKALELAEEKAKKALKDMSVFVPYGITDVKLAYDLYKDSNQYGYTPEQAIRSRAGYENFNLHSENIVQVNSMPLENAGKYTTVEQAIPNAREYYNSGYTNVNDMARVDQIADLLVNTSAFKGRLKEIPEFAMKIDETLKRKRWKN